jgi:DNA polymerase-3 subunit delta'
VNELKFENALKSSRAYNILKRDIESGLSHAYMLVTPDDEAAYNFFMLAACTLFCASKTACGECPECLKTLHRNHPNVVWLNLNREQIKVEDIRELTQSAFIKAFDDNPKVYFVLCADQMNAAAQNKLLKTLEEPPQGVTVFLGVSNASAVKDTIISRCRIIYLDVFDYDAVFSEIMQITQDKELSAAAAACSEGELGKALKIATAPVYLDIYKKSLNLLREMKRSSDIAKFLTPDALPQSPADFLDVLSIILRDMLAAKHDEKLVLSKHVKDEIIDLSRKFSERALAEIINLIVDAKNKLFFHINIATVLQSLYLSMLEVKYKWR